MASNLLNELLQTQGQQAEDEGARLFDDYYRAGGGAGGGGSLFSEADEEEDCNSTPTATPRMHSAPLKETRTTSPSAPQTSIGTTGNPLAGTFGSGTDVDNLPHAQTNSSAGPSSLHGPSSAHRITTVNPSQLFQPTPGHLAGRVQHLVPVPVQQRSQSAAPTSGARLAAPQGMAPSNSAGPLLATGLSQSSDHVQSISKIRRAPSAAPSDTNVPAPVPSNAKGKQPARTARKRGAAALDGQANPGPSKNKRRNTGQTQASQVEAPQVETEPTPALPALERRERYYGGVAPEIWIRIAAQMIEYIDPRQLPILDPHVFLGNSLSPGAEKLLKSFKMLWSEVEDRRTKLMRLEQLLNDNELNPESPAVPLAEGVTSTLDSDGPVDSASLTFQNITPESYVEKQAAMPAVQVTRSGATVSGATPAIQLQPATPQSAAHMNPKPQTVQRPSQLPRPTGHPSQSQVPAQNVVPSQQPMHNVQSRLPYPNQTQQTDTIMGDFYPGNLPHPPIQQAPQVGQTSQFDLSANYPHHVGASGFVTQDGFDSIQAMSALFGGSQAAANPAIANHFNYSEGFNFESFE